MSEIKPYGFVKIQMELKWSWIGQEFLECLVTHFSFNCDTIFINLESE